MTLRTHYQFECNICNSESELIRAPGGVSARNKIRKQGWRLHEGNKDICPRCIEELYAIRSHVPKPND